MALPGDARDADGMLRLLRVQLSCGGPLDRALAAPPARILDATLRAYRATSAAVLSLDLPLDAAPQEVAREVEASLRQARPPVAAAALAREGLTGPEATRLSPILAAAMAPGRVTWVVVAGSGEGAGRSVSGRTGCGARRRSGEERERYVAASATLRCPASGDTRAPTEGLEALHGLGSEAWRRLAREVAADPELGPGLEREIADRCGELAWLRRRLPPRRLLALHEAWACTIRKLTDPEERHRQTQALLGRHGLDSAVLQPALAMGRLDPTLARAMAEVEGRCPAPGERGTP
jgi:hypothetical protein